VKLLFRKQNCSRNRIAPSQEQCSLGWDNHLKLSQIYAPPNFSGRGASRSALMSGSSRTAATDGTVKSSVLRQFHLACHI